MHIYIYIMALRLDYYMLFTMTHILGVPLIRSNFGYKDTYHKSWAIGSFTTQLHVIMVCVTSPVFDQDKSYRDHLE